MNKRSTWDLWGRKLWIGGAAGLLYLLTLSRAWSGDSIRFALAAEQAGLRQQIEPHALLLAPLAKAVFYAWTTIVPSGRVMLPLAAVNAISMAVIVVCAHQIVLDRTQRPRLAAWTALGLAASNSSWLLATSAEMVTPALALAMIPLALVLTAGAERFRSLGFALGTGLLVALAAMATQSHLVLIPAIAVAWWRHGALEGRAGRRAFGFFLVAALGSWLLVYAGTIYAIVGVRDLAALSNWRLHSGLGQPYGILSASSLPHAGYAFLRSLAGFPELGLNDSSRDMLAANGPSSPRGLAFLALYGLVALMTTASAWLAWRHRKSMSARHGTAVAALLTFGLLHAIFATWWLPGDLSFWLPATLAWWLLASLLVDSMDAGRDDSAAIKPLRRHAMALLGLALLALNGLGLAIPNRLATSRAPEHHPELRPGRTPEVYFAWGPGETSLAEVSRVLEDRFEASDLAIVIDDGRLFAQGYYATAGRATSPFQLLPGHPLSPEPAGTAMRSPEALSLLLDSMVDSVHQRGGRVYLVGLATADAGLWEQLAPAGIRAETFEPYSDGSIDILMIGPESGSDRPQPVIQRVAVP